MSKNLKSLLLEHKVTLKKAYGQNFLTDESVLLDIVAAAEPDSDTCVLEIGPGMGVLTRELAKTAGKVVAVEVDTTILPILKKNLSEFQNVTVVNEDILTKRITKSEIKWHILVNTFILSSL